MNKIVYTILSLLACISCSDSLSIKYNIHGNLGSNFVNDGDKLYLVVQNDTATNKIDSCEVAHGDLNFEGKADSVMMASIGSLPIVLEDGEVTITAEGKMIKVSGTPLNEKLSKYLIKRGQISAELDEIDRLPERAIMNGTDMDVAVRTREEGIVRLLSSEDSLATAFVTENFDNILGVYAFQEYAVQQAMLRGYLLTPWMESIMTKATDKFKKNKEVIRIYEQAKQEEEERNGLSGTTNATPAMNPIQTQVPEAASPNELAKPSE